MIDTLLALNWAAVAQIIMIDLLLGGDNAVVIGLACRGLPPHQRQTGILLGTAGAIGLRVLLIVFAVNLLSMPWLKLVGGLMLVWIGVKLLVPGDPDPDDGPNLGHAGTTLAAAVRTVIVADLVMSIDNVIGIAAAAEQADADHRLGLVIFGLLVSVPIIVWGSHFVIRLIERFPPVIWFGGAVLGWIAGGMVITDVVIENWIGGAVSSSGKLAAEVAGVLIVIVVARLLIARRPAELPHRS